MNGPDYILDIPGLSSPQENTSNPQASGPRTSASQAGVRPWLAIRWKCCGTYSRIYRNREGDAYEGRCPRCAKLAKAIIGTGGSDARFFEAG